MSNLWFKGMKQVYNSYFLQDRLCLKEEFGHFVVNI